jgi:uncharacterized RDD family membrane protein YckC
MTEKETLIEIFFSKQIDKYKYSNPRIQRVSSMFMDHIIMCIIISPLIFVFSKIESNFEEYLNEGIEIFLVWSPMFLYFNKDFFKSKSFAKRFLGYQVIDNKTKMPASELQCFIRNLTFIICPIEIIFGIIKPERRIGDYLAKTKVVVSDKENLLSLCSDIKQTNLNINSVWILIIGCFYFYGLDYFMP